jgi:uncharacterized membrane protein YdbT with pleckstrin-like domain
MKILEGETIVWEGHPSWKAMIVFYIKWILISLIPIAIWVGIHAGGAHTGAWWFSVVSVIGIVVTLVGGWIRRQTIQYVVSDRRIGIRTGIVSRNERTTHLDRVQNVAMRQGVIQRLMGIGDVDWDTAGTTENDADFTFYGIDDPSHLVHLVDHYHSPGPPEAITRA